MPALVILESPFKGANAKEFERNVLYAQFCVLDSLQKGEAPYASHLLYTQVLNEQDPAQRSFGIDAGLEFGTVCSKSVVYTDLGISSGMQKGIDHALRHGREVQMRTLPPELKAAFEARMSTHAQEQGFGVRFGTGLGFIQLPEPAQEATRATSISKAAGSAQAPKTPALLNPPKAAGASAPRKRPASTGNGVGLGF